MIQIARKSGQDIVHRCKENPLITIDELPLICSDIWNAGVVRLKDRYLLLMTVETLEGSGCIYLARSSDGYRFKVDSEPFMTSSTKSPFARYETIGVFDPRITKIDSIYYITYLAESEYGRRIGLACTDDFSSVERMQFISQPDTKCGCLFSRTFNGRYAMLERPAAGDSIWLSYSDDLLHWGLSTVVFTPRGGFWDSNRVGVAGPPIEINEGWLLIYYGEKYTSGGPLVRLGAAILDKDKPSNVLGRSNIPILAPRTKYERIGDVGNIVFSCGSMLEENKEIKIYYGVSDSCICLGTACLDEIIELCNI
jgi:beta-1,4-mannooligosaccharide/beta-1,4-mannosyl-N-acetylglucosamine phosphorylase